MLKFLCTSLIIIICILIIIFYAKYTFAYLKSYYALLLFSLIASNRVTVALALTELSLFKVKLRRVEHSAREERRGLYYFHSVYDFTKVDDCFLDLQ